MRKKKLSCRFLAKLFLIIICSALFYFEIITYSSLPFQWINSSLCVPSMCKKILLIADPQLLGIHEEEWNIINFLAKWDSDEYVKKTFIQAFEFVKPEVVIFLGDLMDEGHISSDQEFYKEFERFKQIFHFSTLLKDVHKIYLPGDNDIGGIEDIMLPQIVHRFDNTFNQSDGPLFLEKLQFYKVNFMTYDIEEPNKLMNNDDSLRIALSHIPLLPNPSQFLKTVINKIRPQLIFSSHIHGSVHFITSENNIWERKYIPLLPNDTEWKTFRLHSGLIHEFVVPTCSYRMGVKDMGYGVAYIDMQSKLLHYNVLWLPRRFTQLYFYYAIFSIIFLIVIACFSMYILQRIILKK